ncbi:hypothetical protein [Mycolicibacterium mageritense]|uniref:hypothetical protein n=1 Tax=Mycolicibacterium mageritense TaxID=53462 RepID=UPI002572C54D|nr:hypothetical protein [Mycolicibacterium mageritense]
MTEPTPIETPEPPAAEAPTDVNAGLVEARDRYRGQRDTARQELAAANERIARMQRAEVERLASAGLSHPEDLFSLSGNDIGDYLTDDGDIDPAKVAADVEAILSERPGLRRPAPAADRSQGLGTTAATSPENFSGLFHD